MAPLSPGNYWKYVISEDGVTLDDSICFKVEDSTTVINGREYYTIFVKNPISSGFRYYRFSKDSFYVMYDTQSQDSIYKYLKAGANIGDTWIQQWYNTTLYFSVRDSYPVYIWGNIYEGKEIYLTNNGLISMYLLWTDSLGLVSEYSEGQSISSLAGCVINGQLYGDTTMYVTSVEEIENQPLEFVLMQNYPNPFNPTTTINYQLAHPGLVTLKVYNVLGREVELLVDEEKSAGSYSIDFDASELASGIYIYQLRVNDYISSKKMLLIK